MDLNSSSLMAYQEAVSCLQVAAAECQKSANVDIMKILTNSRKCAQLLHQIRSSETDALALGALEQLNLTLEHHEKVLTAKIQQLDGQNQTPASDAKKVDGHKSQVQPPNGEDMSQTPRDEEKRSRQLAIADTIVPKGQLRFKDVAGLQGAKQALTEAIIMPLQYPHLFTGRCKPWKRILLYGPPGTGKSRLAQALASEISSTFYCVSSSDLVSSWVGESEKLIKELFVHATKQNGRSVIFIDEIDSICRKRSMREEEHTRRIKTELLKQMESADNSKQTDKVFLLCATNCPWELDSAFLRRFQKRIYIPLPDEDARLQLMKIHSQENDVRLDAEEWSKLVENTDGYSGSDIATMVLGALFQPIRNLQNAQYWLRTPDDNFTPCDSSEQGAFQASMTELPPERVHPRPVTIDDFRESMATHRSTITEEELQKFQEFTKTFGQNG